jgi:hypothetical protein
MNNPSRKLIEVSDAELPFPDALLFDFFLL